MRAAAVLLPAHRFALLLTAHHIPFEQEFRFHPTRRWRADFKIGPTLLVEVEGGVWIRGRHSRGGGMEADMEKYAAALMLGYRVLRISPKHIDNGQALAWVQALLP